MTERRDMTGALFANDRREKETHPNYKGSITINGQEYWLDAWIKDGAKGKWMSMSAKPKKLPADQTRQPAFEDSKADDGFTDQIPF